MSHELQTQHSLVLDENQSLREEVEELKTARTRLHVKLIDLLHKHGAEETDENDGEKIDEMVERIVAENTRLTDALRDCEKMHDPDCRKRSWLNDGPCTCGLHLKLIDLLHKHGTGETDDHDGERITEMVERIVSERDAARDALRDCEARESAGRIVSYETFVLLKAMIEEQCEVTEQARKLSGADAWADECAKLSIELSSAQTALATEQARTKALAEQRDATQAKLERHVRDWAETDTAIKAICAKYGIDTSGDSYGVPDMVQCVEELENKLEQQIAELVKERDDEHRKLEQAVDERDESQQAISQIYFIIFGRAAEWSNLFGVEAAVEEMTDGVNALKKALRESEASAAVLREALEQFKTRLNQSIDLGHNVSFSANISEAVQNILKSTTAGADLLARLINSEQTNTQLRSEVARLTILGEQVAALQEENFNLRQHLSS